MCSIFAAGGKGQGLKAAEDILAGSLVTEYVGKQQIVCMHFLVWKLHVNCRINNGFAPWSCCIQVCYSTESFMQVLVCGPRTDRTSGGILLCR